MKTKRNGCLVLILALTISISAQPKHKKDRNAIKTMCGCFEVSFNFAETFHYSSDSTYQPSKPKLDKGLEWAELVEDTKNKISIQHLLQVGSAAEPYIVKHWRQDWLYENRNFYMFNGDNQWNFIQKPKQEVKKQWTQKVYQVDDSPRYEGSGSWVHIDGKSYWENTTTAPLPRREYTKRNDYNITLRGNRHEVTEYGWLHDQDNQKIIRKKGINDVVLAHEKGYNTYVKVSDDRCQAAQNWWAKNKEKWQLVRRQWHTVYAKNQDITLASKINNKPLYKFLFSDAYTTKKKIDTIIDAFILK